jgi:RNA polymerase sigma factor (sigma-70 family)
MADERQIYEQVLETAMSHAVRHLSWDAAFEIAYDVASDLAVRFHEVPSGALIYRSVTYRLRNYWRATHRRAAAQRVFHDEREDGPASSAEPSRDLEAGELGRVVADVIAAMPEGMRDVFRLIRHEELSYREAADRLGVGIGTVHTQLSRANALLRRAVADYRRDGIAPHGRSLTGRQA